MRLITAMFLCTLLVPTILFGTEKQNDVGFLVIAPDRGFMGNEEVRDAFEEYRKNFSASLVFITKEETERFLKEGIDRLEQAGAKKIVVIPLFLSAQHPLYKHAVQFLEGGKKQTLTSLPITIAESMSRSYLTAEILSDRIASLSKQPGKEALIIVASGASTNAEQVGIKNDVEHLDSLIQGRYGFTDKAIIVLSDSRERSRASWEQLENLLAAQRAKNLVPVLIPFDFTQKADGMMAFRSRLAPLAKKYNAAFNGEDITPHALVALWLSKQSNSYLPITKENLGIIFMPHGSNYNWNRTMMDAIESLQGKYLLEPAFSMGDPLLIERAVRKLERRGARAIVVLRVFSLESSFKDVTEYTLGLRDHMGNDAHGHDGEGTTPPRVRSGSVFYTLGGVEASPLFAEALFDRALEVSKDPKKETIILLAHGTESEETNKHWEENLAKLTSHMGLLAKLKVKPFRDIQFATWREDWPELREKAIENIKGMVQNASEDGGTAIVIPARTTRGGREEEWLKGLNYVYNGNGFAPHPMFVRWVEEQIQLSLAFFNKRTPPAGIISTSTPVQYQHSGKH